jgi:hypothetical protein
MTGVCMNREEIKQRVLDTLGIILIDKSAIHEDSTFKDLALDDEDVEKFLLGLGNEFGFTFPDAIRKRASDAPDHLTLPTLVDLIVLMRREEQPVQYRHASAHEEQKRTVRKSKRRARKGR